MESDPFYSKENRMNALQIANNKKNKNNKYYVRFAYCSIVHCSCTDKLKHALHTLHTLFSTFKSFGR